MLLFCRLNLPLLFNEAILLEGDAILSNLHECVLDEAGNTLLHYCVFYGNETIGSHLLERSGGRWWQLVLQVNIAGRNAIGEARWLGVVPRPGEGGGEGTEREDEGFAARISVG